MAKKSTAETVNALWYIAPGQAEIRQEELGPPEPGELRVRALYGALSRGTEALVLNGRVPRSEYTRMRGPFMGGEFPFPVKYGYATVGRVEIGPPELIDQTVFTLHPHQDRFNIPRSAVVLVPANVPSQRAVLAANMETALNAMWDARPAPADRIAVVGAGAVGAMVSFLCGQLPGAEVTLVDINPARAEQAKRIEVGFSTPERAKPDCDIVFHCSGSAAGLETAIALAGDEASIIELSWYGDAQLPLSLGGPFHSRRLRLISSQVGKVAGSHRARWTHSRRLAAAIELLSDARLDSLLGPPVDFVRLPDELPRLLSAGRDVVAPLISYR